MVKIEHVHINVSAIAETLDFLSLAAPDLQIRGGGDAEGFGPWVHLGDDDNYVALTEVPGSVIPKELRHIGVVVDDLEGLMGRLQEAGIKPSDASALDSHPYRRRVYYVDSNGVDWEFVEYLCTENRLRNDYSQ